MINLSVCPLTHTRSQSASVLLEFSLTVSPPHPPRNCENKGQFSSTSRLDLMEYLERGEMGREEGEVLKNTTTRCWNEHVYVQCALVLTAHVKNCVSYTTSCEPPPPPSSRAALFSCLLLCPGIYSSVVMLFAFLHVTHTSSQRHMEREREREEGLIIKK